MADIIKSIIVFSHFIAPAMLYFVCESTHLIALTVPIPMLENGSFRAHNRLVVTVLQYFYSTLLYHS